MLVHQHAATGDGFDHRDTPALGKFRQVSGRVRVVHAAPGDDQRTLCFGDQGRPRRELGAVGARPPDAMHHRLEEDLRVIERFALRVLRQAEECRATVGGIEQRGDRLRQRLQDLLRAPNPVPVARHGAKGVVHRGRRRFEMLDLLEHGIGKSVGESVAGKKEYGQAVGMSDRRRGHHVGRAGPDRAHADHDASAQLRLRVGDSCQGHRLLVLAAPGGQPILHRFERLGEARDIAVAENPEYAGEQRLDTLVSLDLLGTEITDQGLSHGQADCLHRGHSSGKRDAGSGGRCLARRVCH